MRRLLQKADLTPDVVPTGSSYIDAFRTAGPSEPTAPKFAECDRIANKAHLVGQTVSHIGALPLSSFVCFKHISLHNVTAF